MKTKQSNPKDLLATKKLAFSALPWQVLCRVALAMMEGSAKYGRQNYRGVGVRASVYFDACVGRHLTEWWEGEDIDADSGLHHVDKAIAGLMVMRDSMLQGNFVDDRPMSGKAVDMKELNAQAARILELHADKSPRHYTIADNPVADVPVVEFDDRILQPWMANDGDLSFSVPFLVEFVTHEGKRGSGLTSNLQWTRTGLKTDIVFFRPLLDEPA